MKNLLSVTIDNSPKIFNYIVEKDVKLGEKVVVESERGITIADVKKKVSLSDDSLKKEHPRIIRIATNKDLIFLETKKELEYVAKQYCLERIVYRNMKMKIVDVKYMLHSSKVIFYFTADGRVDFRSLVKDLASRLKARIEMRQIGVRDQAQIVGGIGVCGRELCCHSFMGNFLPVSLDDAKQSGSGNSDKLIGVCGRFMCCLKFEENSEKCKNCSHAETQGIESQHHSVGRNSNVRPATKVTNVAMQHSLKEKKEINKPSDDNTASQSNGEKKYKKKKYNPNYKKNNNKKGNYKPKYNKNKSKYKHNKEVD